MTLLCQALSKAITGRDGRREKNTWRSLRREPSQATPGCKLAVATAPAWLLVHGGAGRSRSGGARARQYAPGSQTSPRLTLHMFALGNGRELVVTNLDFRHQRSHAVALAPCFPATVNCKHVSTRFWRGLPGSQWARWRHVFLHAPAARRVYLRRDSLRRLGQHVVAGLPLPPNRAHDEAFQCPHGFATRLALRDPPRQVGLRRHRVARLHEGNPIEDSVQAAVAATIQPMAHALGRGRCYWGTPAMRLSR